jgi:hypothetical protein
VTLTVPTTSTSDLADLQVIPVLQGGEGLHFEPAAAVINPLTGKGTYKIYAPGGAARAGRDYVRIGYALAGFNANDYTMSRVDLLSLNIGSVNVVGSSSYRLTLAYPREITQAGEKQTFQLETSQLPAHDLEATVTQVDGSGLQFEAATVVFENSKAEFTVIASEDADLDVQRVHVQLSGSSVNDFSLDKEITGGWLYFLVHEAPVRALAIA